MAEEAQIQEQLQEYIEASAGRIQAQVSSFEHGLQIYKDLSVIRVSGNAARLLIMEDYMPIIGEVDGAVDFISKSEVTTMKDVKGIFCHEHNVFFFLLKENLDGK